MAYFNFEGPADRHGASKVRFSVLGPLEVSHDGQTCTPSAPKVRQVLALLLLRANQIVSLDSLIEELWGNNPPQSAVTTTQTYIYQLRKTITRYAGPRVAEEMIVTTPPGYLVRISDEQLDYRMFDRMMAQARALYEDGQIQLAAERLRAALEMWTDYALNDVIHGSLLQSYVTHLDERYITALELRVQSEMQLGHHRDLIPELGVLVRRYPFNEWFHAQLMIALHRAGRRGDALSAYQNARRILSEELGLEPSASLKRIHQGVLTAT
jgi:DNA-binding SARP family transcriptional activator